MLSARMRPLAHLRPLNLGVCEHFLNNVFGVWCILSEKPAWHGSCNTPSQTPKQPRQNSLTLLG